MKVFTENVSLVYENATRYHEILNRFTRFIEQDKHVNMTGIHAAGFDGEEIRLSECFYLNSESPASLRMKG